jgi:hypothetical protein
MKTSICKGTLAAAACLTLGIASLAQADTCSNASLKGAYGQAISGQILPGPGVVLPQNGVAMTWFDGDGHFTQVDYVMINGVPQSAGFQTETGPYHVNSNCTGTATIVEPNGSINLRLVVVNEGKEFRTVVSGLTLGGQPVPANIGSSGTRVDDSY